MASLTAADAGGPDVDAAAVVEMEDDGKSCRSGPDAYHCECSRVNAGAHLLFNAFWRVSNFYIFQLYMRDSLHHVHYGTVGPDNNSYSTGNFIIMRCNARAACCMSCVNPALQFFGYDSDKQQCVNVCSHCKLATSRTIGERNLVQRPRVTIGDVSSPVSRHWITAALTT